jgi:hypothetical protein
VADVPYRLWSNQTAEAPPARHTIVAKLRTSTAHARRVALGIAGDEASEPETRLSRLVTNARVRNIRPVFPQGAMATAAAGPAVSRARGLVTIEVARGESPAQMARHLRNLRDEVEYAYVPPPRRMFARRAPTRSYAARGARRQSPDPMLSRQWGHSAVRIAEARVLRGFKEATSIVVAVADSGIDRAHPDLKGVVKAYKNFVKGESAKDFEGHGTHVTGIVAAAMNNGIGVSGLCAAGILALKVLPSRVEWDAEGYYRALGYCIGRARVLNLSLGAEELDPGERDVIADLIDAGIVVVAAVGNEHEEGNPVEYPAALPGVCAVGAVDHVDRRGSFSNTGKHLSISAPGVEIVSTTPTYKYENGKSDYDSWDGSSMATPHVSAAAALLLAKSPELTPAQVIKKLQQKATRVAGMKKRPSTAYGWGRLDIEAVLK